MRRFIALALFILALASSGALGAVILIHQGAHGISSAATFPLKVVGGILTTQGGTPYLILGDAPQGANKLPLCSAGNTYALCAPGGVLSSDTLPTNQTFVAYAKDRQAQGFNSLWINITCESYTRCDNAGATQEGTYPFTTQLSGSVMSGESCPESTPPSNVNCWDLSTAGAGASAAYWTHIDGYFQIAAQLGMQVLADPAPTDACSTSANGGSFAYTFANNYVNAGNSYTKITSFANFLANRYKNQPNIIWFLGNDFNCFETLPGVGVPFVYISQVENSLFQFASTLKASDPNHLITLELNGLTASLLDGTGENGGATNAWSTVLGLNGTYANQGPPYDAALMASALNSSMPILFVEGDYQGEDIGNINDGSCTRTGTAGTPPVTICNTNFGPFLSAASHCGFDYISGGDNSAPAGDPNSCAFRERVQFWDHTLAGGAAGYVDGNHYTWTFDPGWPTTGVTTLPTNCHTISSSNNCLDTAANIQLKNSVAFVETVSWYKLVPDVTRSGGGTAKGTPTARASPFVTGCYGTATQQACANAYYIDGNHTTITSAPPQLTMQSAYPVSGVASDATFGIAYIPGVNPACNGTVYPPTNCNAATSLAITVNDGKINGGANLTAAWYDPTGAMTSGTVICQPSGVPATCAAGSHTYTTPGSLHADGTADWVLLVSAPAAPAFVSVGPATPSFAAPSTNGATLEAMTATMSSGSFTGSYSLTSANGGCASTDNASFAISGSNLNFAAVLGAGTYHICVRATQAGASNSPFDTAFTITGTSGAATAFLSASNLGTSSLNSGVSTTIPNGGSAVLTWDSTNAASCTSTDFATGNSPGIGTVTVSPTTTTTYHLTCGSASTTAVVAVSGTRRDPAGSGLCAANGGGDGTSGNAWHSACINAAVSAAAAGDTIFLAAGNWQLNTSEAAVVVTKAINFVGAGSGNTFDAMGHPNNPSPANLAATPGGNITAVRSSGPNVILNCVSGGYIWLEGTNDNMSHIYFDGTTGSTGLSACALPTYNGNTGPGILDDVRALQMADSSYGPSSEGRISANNAQNITMKNSIVNNPIDIQHPGNCMNAAFQMSAVNGFSLINSYLYHMVYNAIYVESVVVNGSVMFMQDDSNCNDTVLLAAFGPDGTGIGPGATSNFDAGEGSYHVNVTNSYFPSAGHYFGLGTGVNDPTTNGGISDLNYTGNWVIASNTALDSCANHAYDPNHWTGNFNTNYQRCAPRDPAGGGMQINAVWQPWLNCATASTSDPPNRDNVSVGYGLNYLNNSVIGTAGSSSADGSVAGAAQLVATGTGIVPCKNADQSITNHIGTVVNFRAHQNYLSSPTNRYVSDADTFNPNVPGAGATGNYCDNATHSGVTTFTGTDGQPCATTGFTTLPTVSFTLGTLANSVVPINNQAFTAQYGAVKWIASTSSTTPTSGDGRWSYTPPFTLAVTHGSTVYLWVMDSNNNISAAASQAVP